MMRVDYASTVCRCGWTPTSKDDMAARDEVYEHHVQHADGRLPDYETYPPMPPIEQPEAKVRRLARALLDKLETERSSLKRSHEEAVRARQWSRESELVARMSVIEAVQAEARALREALEG